MAVLTTQYHVEMANLAIQSFANGTPKYVFISRPNPWVDVNRSYDDTIVPLANLCIFQTEGTIYTDLVFGKLITPQDIMTMVPRYDWTPGTVYARYWNKDEYLYSENFYVVTDELNIFKCIDNNYGSPSTIKPTVTSAQGNFFTADGYLWKYMYTIPSDINSKFSTRNFIPVMPNNSVVANAISGTVDIVDLTSFGNNYTAFYSGFLQNSVNSYVVVIDGNASPYSNYYVGSSMYLKAGYGAGQIREIVQYDGLNKFVRLDSPFDNYGVFSLANTSGSFNIGDTLVQKIDNLAIYYNVGIFRVGDIVIQSDTGAIASIVAANSTYLNVVRSTPTLFSLNIPIYGTSQAGNLESGFVTCQPFSTLTILSNTGAFVPNEVVYQRFGTANIAVGKIFSSQTGVSISSNFNPVLAINTTANFIALSNNQFTVGMEVFYSVTSGNTVVFGLVNNTSYYVAYANTSGITLSNTPYGANVSLALSYVEHFNPNTNINVNNFISISNNQFINGEPLIYTVSTGNTIPVGLSTGHVYYAVYANSAGLCLSQTLNGPNVDMLATNISETGHNLTFTIPLENGDSLTYAPVVLSVIPQINGYFTNTYPIKGVSSGSNAYIIAMSGNNMGLSYAISTNTAQTAFTTEYSIGDYIRIGSNTSLNIRRITSVNSTCVVMDSPVTDTYIANVHYSMPYAAEVASYTLLSSNGLITNTNLNSVQINFSNVSLSYQLFIPGERVDMVDFNNIFQGTYGFVSFCNTDTIIISEIIGSGFIPGYYLEGESSVLNAYINRMVSYPNITISNPVGNFVLGQQIYSCNSADLSLINGQANIISWYTIPGQLTEYVISPTVTIEGDGEGALAYSTVNTSLIANFPLANVVVLNTGTGYTYANVVISSNLMHGSGATALASISPRLGHGANPYSELGASYVSVSVNISNSMLEDYYFPSFGDYRIIGILDNPLFDNLYVNVDKFDRVQLSIEYATNAFSVGEIVYQPNTLAGGIVVYSNASYLELKNVKGTFSANGLYPNNTPSNDNVVGMFSNSIANVNFAQTAYFNVVSDNELVYEVNSRANAILVSTTGTSNLQLTNVSGRFVAGDMLYDPENNAYAIVETMAIGNDMTDATISFGYRFNQTLRFPLTSNNGSFEIFEYLGQEISGANGQIIGGSVDTSSFPNVVVGNDIDLTYTNTASTFAVGSVIQDANTDASAIVIWSNTSYLRLNGVSGNFFAGDLINSTIGLTATVSAVYPVLILNDVSGEFTSGALLSGKVNGSNTGTSGRCDLLNVIQYPDLVRDTGEVLYLENLAPFSLSNNSKESISLLLQY